jgi:hypothetical protein
MDKNPALSAFVAGFETELNFGEVWIRRLERGFELRHVADRECDPAILRLLEGKDIRTLAQFTIAGVFRPLKSAPTLQRGWRATPGDEEALGAALNQLYPGGVADWFASQTPLPPVTSYREFTGRQTGMYRITTRLDDGAAGAVIRACCHKDFCLKRRLWTVEGLPDDPPAAKSALPCLEPCAILLEFARKIARVEQDERTQPAPDPADSARRRDEAKTMLKNPDATAPECDFDAPNNPRRLRFVLERSPAPVTPQPVE